MRNNSKYRYLIADFVTAIIVWILFFLFRRVVNDFVLFKPDEIVYFELSLNLWASAVFYPFLSVFVHYLTGFYNEGRQYSRIVEFFSSLISAFFIAIVTLFVLLLDDEVISYTFYYKAFLVLIALQFTVSYFARFIITSHIYMVYASGRKIVPLLIVGTGNSALDVSKGVARSKQFVGRKLVGFVTLGRGTAVEENRVRGNVNELEKIVEDFGVKEVIISADGMDENDVFTIVNRLLKYGVSIMFAPRLYEIVMGKVHLGDIYTEPMVSVDQISMPAWQQSFKRIFDVLVSLFALLLLLPLNLYLMLRIKMDSPGPVFYSQKRVGLRGKEFGILKYRTMVDGAENGVPLLTQKNDDRITKFGAVMRKYRLDELPQFCNIIKGDMAIVGPRPERRHYIAQIEEKAPYYCMLYKIRPGLFSWGPIKIGYADTVDKMVDRLKYDIVYMDNMSLATDLKILFYSVEVLVNGKGQ